MNKLQKCVISVPCDVKEDVVVKIEKWMLSWFLVERMTERRLIKQIRKASASGYFGGTTDREK